MNTLSKTVSVILDRIYQLLTTEPARLIGYGAAVVVFLVAQGLNYVRPGILPVVSFEQSLGLAFSASAMLVVLVESIRRFVYSPATHYADLNKAIGPLPNPVDQQPSLSGTYKSW